jgi:hypothetical protein
MNNTLESRSDQDLISIIMRAPKSPDAEAARDILEYRKYRENKKLNQCLVWLTVVLAISALLQVLVDILPK